jgi:hypothetical protein
MEITISERTCSVELVGQSRRKNSVLEDNTKNCIQNEVENKK